MALRVELHTALGPSRPAGTAFRRTEVCRRAAGAGDFNLTEAGVRGFARAAVPVNNRRPGPPGEAAGGRPVISDSFPQRHATRHGATCYVYNGLDAEDYASPTLTRKKNYLHFLGKAAWRVKNVRGAIRIAQRSKTPLRVLGGTRLNLHMGFYALVAFCLQLL